MEGLRPVSCSFHKLPGMIDVVSARCQEPVCTIHRCVRGMHSNTSTVSSHFSTDDFAKSGS